VESALNCGGPGSDCTIQKVDIVGPTAGIQLQHQAELGYPLFAAWNADLPLVPLRVDLRRGCPWSRCFTTR